MRSLQRTRQAPLLALGLCGALLTGCGDDEGSDGEQGATPTVTVTATPSPTDTATPSPTESTPTVTESTPSPSPDDTDGTDDTDDTGAAGGSGQAAGLPPRPRRGECVEITTPRNGRYRVYDAGRAVVRRDGGQLRIGGIDPAPGWQARVTERGGDDDVEIEFRHRRRGGVLELEVELDDGGVESQICADDRDDDD